MIEVTLPPQPPPPPGQPIPARFDGERLREELAAVGVSVGQYGIELSGDVVRFPDLSGATTRDKIVSVLSSHDPTVPATTTTNRRSIETNTANILTDLKTIENSTGTLSAAALSNGLRLVARAIRLLIRLQLRLFDAVD